MIDNDTRPSAIGFLVWLHGFYKGEPVTDTYKEIASHHGGCNYTTARNYIFELSASGYLQIENKGKAAQRIVLNTDKYEALVGYGTSHRS